MLYFVLLSNLADTFGLCSAEMALPSHAAVFICAASKTAYFANGVSSFVFSSSFLSFLYPLGFLEGSYGMSVLVSELVCFPGAAMNIPGKMGVVLTPWVAHSSHVCVCEQS